MELKINLTLDELEVITAALHNDALTYLECAKEEVEDKDYFNENVESYRERMLLKRKFDKLYMDNMYRIEG